MPINSLCEREEGDAHHQPARWWRFELFLHIADFEAHFMNEVGFRRLPFPSRESYENSGTKALWQTDAQSFGENTGEK